MITSSSNIQIKNLVKLQKSTKERQKQKVFIVEGIRMFEEIPTEQFKKAYVTEEFLKEHPELFQEKEYEIVKDTVLKEVSDTRNPQGVLAVVRQTEYTADEILNQNNACIIILENLQDPGNLGTIIRTGEGAGISGVIMTNPTVDIYNPKVVRATMGSIYRVPFVYIKDLEDILKKMKQKNIVTYAAHLDGTEVYQENFMGSTAFLIGNEGNGLTEKASDMAQKKIKIPMCGKVESLNAAIASTILMYEVLRQRKRRD